MTKAELINVVAQKTELSKKDSEKAVVAVIDAISEALAAGEKVALVGFGTFEVKERAAREGINPRTKEKIEIPSSKQAKPSRKSFPSNWNPSGTHPTAPHSRSCCCISRRKTGGITMRLDKYLKITRLIKRRTVANEACDGGRILVNGKVARASYAVKEGDTIEIQMGNRPLKVQVLSVSEYATKESAPEMYRVEE